MLNWTSIPICPWMRSLPGCGTSSAKHGKFCSTGKRLGPDQSSGDHAQVHSMHEEFLAIIFVYVLFCNFYHWHFTQKLGLPPMEIRCFGDLCEMGTCILDNSSLWNKGAILERAYPGGRQSTCRAAARTGAHWFQGREDSTYHGVSNHILSPVQIPWMWS